MTEQDFARFAELRQEGDEIVSRLAELLAKTAWVSELIHEDESAQRPEPTMRRKAA